MAGFFGCGFGLRGQPFRALDVAPVLLAGVDRKQVHIGMFGQGLQQIQIHRRQRGNAERQITLRQARRIQRGQQPFVLRGAVGGGGVGGERAPQRGLPGFVRAQAVELALLPLREPMRAVHQILVEHVRQPPRQMISRRRAAFQVAPQHCGQGRIGAFQQRQQPPAQHFRRKRVQARHIRQEAARELPAQCRRQAEIQIGRNAAALGQIVVEIAAHPLALHHDFLRRKHRFRRRSLHQRNGGFGKEFEAVGRIKVEHGAGGNKQEKGIGII